MSFETFKRDTMKAFAEMNERVLSGFKVEMTSDSKSITCKYENSFLRFRYVDDTTAMVTLKIGREGAEEDYTEVDANTPKELVQQLTQLYVYLMVLITYLVGDASVGNTRPITRRINLSKVLS